MLQVLQCFQKNKIKCFKYFSTFKTYLIIDFSMRVHYTHFQNIDLWAFYAVSAVHKSSESRIFKIIVLIAGFVIVCPKCSLSFVNIPTQFEKKNNSTSNNNAVWRNEGIKGVQEIKLWRKMCKSLLAILWFCDILFMNNHVLKKGY